MHLTELKSRIDKQAYVVDPRLVAEAMMRRGWPGLPLPPLSPLSAPGARSHAAQTDPARRMS